MNKSKPLQILIIDDSEDDTFLIMREIEKGGYLPEEHKRVDTEDALKKALIDQKWDIILCDYFMPKLSVRIALDIWKNTGQDVPFIVVSGEIGEMEAVDLMIAGASDFVSKNNLSRLVPAIKRELQEAENRNKRKQAEQEQKESKQEWENIFQAIGHPTFILNPDFDIIAANKAAINITGLPEEKLLGKKCHQIMHRTKEPPSICPLLKMRLSGMVETTSMKVEALNGEYLVSCTPVFDAEGKLEKIIHIATDISDKKQAEQKIETQLQQKQQILETTLDGYILADDKGQIIDVNPAYCDMIGYSREELQAMNIRQLEVKITAEEVQRRIDQMSNHGRDRFETKHETRDGRFIDLDVSITAMPDENGQLVSAFMKDITERKQMEEYIKESEEKYRALFDNAPLSYQSLDENGCFLDINPAWLITLGYERNEVIGKYFAEFLHPDWKPHFEKNFPAFKKRGYVNDVQFKIRHKDGFYLDISFEGCIGYKPDGSFKQTYCVFQDITERKQTEAALRESEDRYRSIVENSFEGIGLIDDKHTFIYANTNLAKLFGYPLDEVIGADFRKFVAQESLEIVSDRYKRRQKGEEVLPRYEVILLKKNKETTFAELSSSVIKDKKGKVLTIVQLIDNTEKKKAEDRIKESEANLRALIENREDSIWSIDKNFNYITFNSFFAKSYLAAFSLELKKGMNAIDILTPEIRKLWEPKYKSALTGESIIFEFSERIGGNDHFFQVSLNPIITDNDITGVSAISIEITERKQAELEIRKRAQELTAFNKLARQVSLSLSVKEVIKSAMKIVVDAAKPDLVLIFLREKDNLILQDFAPQNSKYTHDETPVHHVGECLCGLAISEAKPMYSKNIHQDVRCTLTECKNAGLFSYAALPLRSGKNLIGVLGIASATERDFSSQATFLETMADEIAVGLQNALLYEEIQQHSLELEKRVKERTAELKQSEAKMKAQYKGIPVPTYTWQGTKNDIRLVDYNDAAVKISRGGIKKFVGITAKEMYHDNPDILNDLNLCFKKKKTIEREMPYLFKSTGEIKYLAVKYAFVLPDLVLVHTEDITQRKKADENLREANVRLQEADRLKSVFLASMSHELRTPLNSIIGFTGIMLMGLSGELKPEQEKQLTMVKNSASHLLSLINDLLDISKIEAGKVQLSKEKFNFHELVCDVTDTFKLSASEKNLELKTQVGRNIILNSDKRRVKQILTNLVSNAIKFTDKGSVQVSASLGKDNKLVIRVSDTGMGIKKNDLSILFSPFQQVDASMTKKHEGIGLGLYLCKNLCSLLGGSISVNSEFGKGSVFTVVLPVV